MRTQLKHALLLLGVGMHLSLISIAQKMDEGVKVEKKTFHIQLEKNENGDITNMDTTFSFEGNVNIDSILKHQGLNISLMKYGIDIEKSIHDAKLEASKRKSNESKQLGSNKNELTILEVKTEKVTTTDIETDKQSELRSFNEQSKKESNELNAENSKEIKISIHQRINIVTLDSKEQEILKQGYNSQEPKIERILIYPNPNNGNFKLKFRTEDNGVTQIEILDKSNTTLYNETLKDFNGDYNKDISVDLKAGDMYYLRITQSNKVWVRRLIIE